MVRPVVSSSKVRSAATEWSDSAPSRYEVRRWQDGVIPDILEAVASPQRLSNDLDRARSVLDLVGSVPALVWGRDELGMGDMRNSNSVVSWLLAGAAFRWKRSSRLSGGAPRGGMSASSLPDARLTHAYQSSTGDMLPCDGYAVSVS